MIGIVNYGLGNIKAFLNVYERLNIPAKVVNSSRDFLDLSKIVLPGVGSFDYAMHQLNRSGLRGELELRVKKFNVPIIGICVGMQMLADSSDEGKLPGLGWIKGKVIKFDTETIPYQTKLPHMGWNTIYPFGNNPLIQNFDIKSKFYFLHSYFFECNNPSDILTKTNYGQEFTSAVSNGNIYGVQFHPEKSHQNGINLLRNFALLC